MIESSDRERDRLTVDYMGDMVGLALRLTNVEATFAQHKALIYRPTCSAAWPGLLSAEGSSICL